MNWIQTTATVATGLFLSIIPTSALAQSRSFYPLDTRAGFLTGCLLEEPPNLYINQEVYGVMSVCLCMLDKFQAVYSHEEFVALSEGYERNQQAQVQELQGFITLNLPACESRLR